MKHLREYRQKCGLSRQEMAEKVHISTSLYEKIELDQRQPSRLFLSKFKAAFPDYDMNIFFDELLHKPCSKVNSMA